ncbi:MAG: bifunctional 5,10-methylenetetrahydrofolate dehydrogenase/5,10-methenyltetrahydrofolate cyclohydrolase [Acidobacteriota bacterium]
MTDSPRSGAQILRGADLAARIRESARREAEVFAGGGRPPHLRVVLLGADAGSETYVAAKTKAAREAGCTADTVRLPSGTAPAALLSEIARGNRDDRVDGLLVQLPLEPGHDVRRVFDTLDPWKDVDGVSPENVGRLHQGRPRFTPCTPAGILALLDDAKVPIAGRRAAVLGRSEIVGKPVAALLTARDATVTLCHSKTEHLDRICAEADILIAAIGRPGFVTREYVRPGAAIIDVGVNRLSGAGAIPAHLASSGRVRLAIEAGRPVLVGDVDFDAVAPIAGWITPVPGGVGPLTVAMLLKNTVLAARLRRERRGTEEMDPLTL